MTTKLWAIILVVFVTLLTSSAQIFYKLGADKLSLNLYSLLTNHFLLAGLLLYGFGAVILIIALKAGEVSVLYPVIATSYIWVALLAWALFGESLSSFKIAGISFIFLGVSCIGVGTRYRKRAGSESA